MEAEFEARQARLASLVKKLESIKLTIEMLLEYSTKYREIHPIVTHIKLLMRSTDLYLFEAQAEFRNDPQTWYLKPCSGDEIDWFFSVREKLNKAFSEASAHEPRCRSIFQHCFPSTPLMEVAPQDVKEQNTRAFRRRSLG